MDKYILCRFENDLEIPIMRTSNLESARKQGEQFKNGYSIYETKLLEYGT